MAQETPETLETLTSQAIGKAELSDEDAGLVREGIIASLQVMAEDPDCGAIDPKTAIDFNEFPVDEHNRRLITSLVRDVIESLFYRL